VLNIEIYKLGGDSMLSSTFVMIQRGPTTTRVMMSGFMSETKSARRSIKHHRERNSGSDMAIVLVFIANWSVLKEVVFRENEKARRRDIS
jgi:hypothetical protein